MALNVAAGIFSPKPKSKKKSLKFFSTNLQYISEDSWLVINNTDQNISRSYLKLYYIGGLTSAEFIKSIDETIILKQPLICVKLLVQCNTEEKNQEEFFTNILDRPNKTNFYKNFYSYCADLLFKKKFLFENAKLHKYLFFVKKPEVDNKFVINNSESKFILNKKTTPTCYKCNFKNFYVSMLSNCSRYFLEKEQLVTLCYNHIKYKFGIEVIRKHSANYEKNVEFTVTNLKPRKDKNFICFFNCNQQYNDVGNYIALGKTESELNCEIKEFKPGEEASQGILDCFGVFSTKQIAPNVVLLLKNSDNVLVQKKIDNQFFYHYRKLKRNAPPTRLTIGEVRGVSIPKVNSSDTIPKIKSSVTIPKINTKNLENQSAECVENVIGFLKNNKNTCWLDAILTMIYSYTTGNDLIIDSIESIKNKTKQFFLEKKSGFAESLGWTNQLFKNLFTSYYQENEFNDSTEFLEIILKKSLTKTTVELKRYVTGVSNGTEINYNVPTNLTPKNETISPIFSEFEFKLNKTRDTYSFKNKITERFETIIDENLLKNISKKNIKTPVLYTTQKRKLKTFQSDPGSVKDIFISTQIADENLNLNLSLKIKIDNQNFIFNLQSFTEYENSNHYYCHFRYENNWYTADDTKSCIVKMENNNYYSVGSGELNLQELGNLNEIQKEITQLIVENIDQSYENLKKNMQQENLNFFNRAFETISFQKKSRVRMLRFVRQ